MTYKLMIVDDEPLFTDGLAECLRDLRDPEWEIYKAYHAKEALQRMERTPVDMMLMDIQMPGMTGLELHKEVQVRWPKCKVIYLTGHNEFIFVQEALRQGGTEYILKTEGDEVIIEALQKAAKELDEELQREQWAAEAKERWHQAKSSLRKTLLLDVVNGQSDHRETMAAQFEELDIPLRADEPVLMVLGKIDQWPSEMKTTDCSLYLFAIQNIAQDLLHLSTNVFAIESDRSHIIWFIQPNEGHLLYDRALPYIEGVMGQVQEKSKTLLRLNISIVMSEQFYQLEELDVQFHRLKNMMFRNFGLQNQLFLRDRRSLGEPVLQEETLTIKKIASLKHALEHNQKDTFLRIVMELADVASDGEHDAGWDQAQLYFELVSLAMATIQQLGMKDDIEAHFDLSGMLKGIQSVPWYQFLNEYKEVMRFIFESRSRDWERQGMDIVLQIKDFIAENLQNDLSLTRIAEHVSYHPAYLSRLYKQLSGKNLSDDIAEMRLKKAEQLMLDKQLKINEVGRSVGFDSPRYFTKFFKLHTGLTPQEYRERHVK